MANRAPRRDYLYVSTKEIERLAADLPTPARGRSATPDVPAGSGGVLSLTDAPSEIVLSVLGEVESALQDQQRVRQVDDADLAVGDWFESPCVQMGYGVQPARRSADSDAAVFVGEIDEHSARAESSLLLGGPAEYLQDSRPISVEDVSGDMSYPSALFGLLASLADRDVGRPSVGQHVQLPQGDRRAPTHRQATTRSEQAHEEQWLAVGYPIAQAQASFGQRGLYPLTFLARAVKIVHFESRGLSGRWIVGTPLWVALQVLE